MTKNHIILIGIILLGIFIWIASCNSTIKTTTIKKEVKEKVEDFDEYEKNRIEAQNRIDSIRNEIIKLEELSKKNERKLNRLNNELLKKATRPNNSSNDELSRDITNRLHKADTIWR